MFAEEATNFRKILYLVVLNIMYSPSSQMNVLGCYLIPLPDTSSKEV